MSRCYQLHGLNVHSEIPIAAPPIRGPAEIDIRWADRRAVPDQPPRGELLAHLALAGTSTSLVRGPGGYTVRLNRICDFDVHLNLREVGVHLSHDADREVASLCMGGVLASVITLRGHCILHASAVERDGHAIAIIGASGMGKSTLAALMCAAGARLVTDDALRVDCEPGGVVCYRGSTQLRLRSGSAELAAQVSAAAAPSTADGRTAAHPEASPHSRLPLGAVVTPVVVGHDEPMRVESLARTDALLELVRFPRAMGWTSSEPTRRDFRVLGRVAAVTPVLRAHVPHGPPFLPDIGEELLAQVAKRHAAL
jgi:hypothetical protein